MLPRVRFSLSPPGGDRVHHISQADIRILLNRLPPNLWHRLRAVHFNDRSQACRLGLAYPGMGEITICALPPRIGLTRYLRMGQIPEQFGARRNRKWPTLAIRRFMLYDVFLHELGHLQPVPNRRSARLSFPRERLAQEFAIEWCDWMWSKSFDHPDPVHNRPSVEEMLRLNEQETPKGDFHLPEPLPCSIGYNSRLA